MPSATILEAALPQTTVQEVRHQSQMCLMMAGSRWEREMRGHFRGGCREKGADQNQEGASLAVTALLISYSLSLSQSAFPGPYRVVTAKLLAQTLVDPPGRGGVPLFFYPEESCMECPTCPLGSSSGFIPCYMQ